MSTITNHVDLDVVVLSEQDGHARLAGVVRTLGEAARQQKIISEDITMDFMAKELSCKERCEGNTFAKRILSQF